MKAFIFSKGLYCWARQSGIVSERAVESTHETVSIIVPTFNEARNIEQLIRRIDNALKGNSYEVVIVDDNSPDGTADLAERLSQNYPVRVVRRPRKLGLSSAILEGFKKSSGRIMVVMDADLQHPPELIPKLVEKIAVENYDIAIASRYVEGGRVEKWSFVRRVVSKGAIALAHMLLPRTREVMDPVSGFFAIKREVVKGLALNPIGYKMLLEVLVKGRWRRAVEIPYTFRSRERGKSKLSVKEVFNYVKHLLRLTEFRPLKFAIVGASGILVNMGLLYFLVLLGLPIYLASPIAIEASILSNFALNDVWTFRSRRSGEWVWRCLKYHLSVLLGGVVNYVVLLLLIMPGLSYLIANMVGILFGYLANYLMSEGFVWSK